MKRILVFAICLSFFSALIGQNENDAFLFSQNDYVGTARYMGAGRAFGAVGGDFSALMSNPAAIGLFKKSEVSITPMSLSILQNEANYYGNNRSSKKMRYAVPQVGLVLSTSINRENSNWRYWHFGFGYNRLKDYNNTYGVEGISGSSFIDPLLDAANSSSSLGLNAQLAFDTWVLDTIPGNSSQYWSPFHNQDLAQNTTIRNSGALDEIAINFGGNYNDQLFIGAGIGIPVLDVTQQMTITETAASGEALGGLSNYTAVTKQHNTGAGINFKLGLIYQPVNFFRFGVGFQTPSFFWKIKDSYYASFSSNWAAGGNEFSEYNNLYHFSLTTPLKANVSAAFIINKRAFISAEYELVDYSLAKLNADDYSFSTENDNIVSKFGISHSFRIGGEVALSQMLYLRAGYNFKTSPYKLADDKRLGSAHYASAGFGIRAKRVFFDMAYVLGLSKDDVWLYNSYYVDPARVNSTYHRVLATIGFKF
ncbi:MAG: outer membrane protein transport protein [Bacteroidales bacterium]|nr:outer membrane protein transport protein [Bacteroidales bacterium]